MVVLKNTNNDVMTLYENHLASVFEERMSLQPSLLWWQKVTCLQADAALHVITQIQTSSGFIFSLSALTAAAG